MSTGSGTSSSRYCPRLPEKTQSVEMWNKRAPVAATDQREPVRQQGIDFQIRDDVEPVGPLLHDTDRVDHRFRMEAGEHGK